MIHSSSSLTASKLERERIQFQNTSKINDDYRTDDIKNGRDKRNTPHKNEEKPSLRAGEKDILTELIIDSRKNVKTHVIQDSAPKLFKSRTDVSPFKSNWKFNLNSKTPEVLPDSEQYGFNDQKNLRIQSSNVGLGWNKPSEDFLYASPSKEGFAGGGIKQARTPNGREGRHSSTPKPPLDSKVKQQIQNIGDFSNLSNSASQDYPMTTGRAPTSKLIAKKPDTSDLPPYNVSLHFS